MKKQIVIFILLLFITFSACKPSDGGGKISRADSNAIVLSYLNTHKMLQNKSYYIAVKKNDTRKDGNNTIGADFDPYTGIKVIPLMGYPAGDVVCNNVPTIDFYTIPITKDSAQRMIDRFTAYAAEVPTEKTSFYINGPKLLAYMQQNQPANIQLISAAYDCNGETYRTFIVSGVDKQGNHQPIATPTLRGTEPGYYEHCLPCPPQSNCDKMGSTNL